MASTLIAGQLPATNHSVYAQSNGPTISSGTCRDDGSLWTVLFSFSNLDPNQVYYWVMTQPHPEGGTSQLWSGVFVDYQEYIGQQSLPKESVLPGEPITLSLFINKDFQIYPFLPEELMDSMSIVCADSIPTTPAEATTELISDVENLGDDVPQGTKTSIAAPLKEASTILTDDNPNNDKSACGKLDASIRQTDAAERRGTLTEDQAAELRTQATDIRTELGC